MPKRYWLFWLAAFLVAFTFDFLFWKKAPGISFLVWIALLLGTGITIAAVEGIKPSSRNIILIAAVIGMAFITAFRSEPFTRFIALALSFSALFILAYSYRHGFWPWFRLQDHLKAFFLLLGAMFSRGFGFIRDPKVPPPLPSQDRHRGRHITLAVLRGILISLPILAILAALLASADPVFSSWLSTLFDLSRLPETLFRLTYILIIAFFITGAFLHAAFPRRSEQKPDDADQIIKPFMGWIESVMVLGLVDILFLVFVVLQFRYLFGAQSNIVAEGFTYAEYARRGFFELVAVAVLSLGLYLILVTISKREKTLHRRLFTGLSLGLISLVLIILASSLHRLFLYEQAYGFSRVRTYTHIFIFWLAGLLLATAVLEVVRGQRWFALSLLIAIFGFGVSLGVINVDGFIVEQNIARINAGQKLDVAYLSSLSPDAVPAILRAFHSQEAKIAQKSIHDQLGIELACRLSVYQNLENTPWQSFLFSDLIARNRLQQFSTELAGYKVVNRNGILLTTFGGSERPCPAFSD